MCLEEHVRILLKSLRALCTAAGGAGSMWKYLEELVRATGVAGRVAYGILSVLHYADVSQHHVIEILKLTERKNLNVEVG
jgi:hypothetical protein